MLAQPLGMLLQQFPIMQQGTTGQGFQGAIEHRHGIALASVAQQLHQLQPGHQRHMVGALAFGLLQQSAQAAFGLRRLVPGTVQGGQLQFDVVRQLGMELGGGSGGFAGVGFRQARQPGFGQLHLPLGQPEIAFGQGDHRQVVDRRHVPDMHQALGFGQLGEGRGKAPFAPFQPGQGAMADQQADIAAGAGFGDARLQADPRRLGLHAHAEQVALVEHQPRPGDEGPRRCRATQALQALLHFALGTQDLATRLQHAGTVVVDQRFEQRVGAALSQLQGLAIEAAGAPEVAPHQGDIAQQRQAEMTKAIVLRRQGGQGFAAEMLGALDIASATGDQRADGLPLHQQVALLRGIRRRQEAREAGGQLLRRVQLAGQAQGQAVEHDQPGRAGQQAVGQVHLPAQQHGDVLIGQQLFFGQVLHQRGRHVRLARAQGLLHGLVQQSLGTEPAAGPQVHAGRRQAGGGAGAQQVGEQVVIAEPVALLVQGHQEHLVGLQVAEDGGAVVALAHGVAELGAEALESGGFIEERLDVGPLPLDHFLQQVFTYQALAAMGGLLGFPTGQRVLTGQQPQA
ncbi:hypothetical protein D3C78_379160 [compost metagenome]